MKRDRERLDMRGIIGSLQREQRSFYSCPAVPARPAVAGGLVAHDNSGRSRTALPTCTTVSVGRFAGRFLVEKADCSGERRVWHL